MPVSSPFKGVSHPQDHILIPGFAVDHQADRQPLTGKATRHRQTTQVQDIANDRVAEISGKFRVLYVSMEASISATGSGGIMVVGTSRASTWRRVSSTLGAQRYPGACRVEILGRADVLALDHTLAHNGVVLLKVCLKARLMDGIRLCGNRQPTWIEFLGFCRFWKFYTFYRAPNPLKTSPQDRTAWATSASTWSQKMVSAKARRRPRTPSLRRVRTSCGGMPCVEGS